MRRDGAVSLELRTPRVSKGEGRGREDQTMITTHLESVRQRDVGGRADELEQVRGLILCVKLELPMVKLRSKTTWERRRDSASILLLHPHPHAACDTIGRQCR